MRPSPSLSRLASLLSFGRLVTSRPSRLQFKTLVDDNTWSIGGNFFLNLPGFSSAVKVYPYFYSTSGMYRYIRNVTSPQLNNTRDLVVYTPPSYNENFLKCVHTCSIGVWRNVWRVACVCCARWMMRLCECMRSRPPHLGSTLTCW